MSTQLQNHTNPTGARQPPTACAGASRSLIQRKCACGGSGGVAGDCETCDQKKLSLQRSTQNAEPETPDSVGVPPIVHDVLRSPGRPIDADARAFFEPRFGHNFGNVRIHSDALAAASAQAVNASAYTFGNHVVLRDSDDRTSTTEGRRLLAHELSHVVQQEGRGTTEASSGLSQPGTASEQEADRVAFAVVHGATAPPINAAGSGIQREDPSVKNLPVGLYVDAYDTIEYDISYRSVDHNLSKWMRVHYDDGTVVDINIDSIGEQTMSAMAMAESMVDHGYVGEGGRVFPQSVNSSTTPRLYAAKRAVLEIMDDYNLSFMLMVFPTVWMILTAGVGVGGGPPRAQRRPLQRTFSEKPPVGEETPPPPAPTTGSKSGGTPRGGVPETGRPGSQRASVEAQSQREAMRPPPTPLSADQVVIRDTLLAEHPGLQPSVATESARGGLRAMGPGGAGADVPLINGGGREVSVHRGQFTPQSIGNHLQGEKAQAGTTEVYLQINTPGASREGLLKMIPGLKTAYPELRGVYVKFFGPDGEAWWNGVFSGPK